MKNGSAAIPEWTHDWNQQHEKFKLSTWGISHEG